MKLPPFRYAKPPDEPIYRAIIKAAGLATENGFTSYEIVCPSCGKKIEQCQGHSEPAKKEE